MAITIPVNTLEKFTTFGDLLRFLRRRAGITQMELAIATGYSDAQISRLELNLRLPDIPTIESRFVSALGLEDDPKAVTHLLDLATSVRSQSDSLIKNSSPSASRALTNIPISLTTFIGREKEQDKIRNLLAKNRLVTLTGSGGVGKTRLAQEVGKKLLPAYPNGVWIAALDPLSNPGFVPHTIASVFGLSEKPGMPPIMELLRNYLHARKALLILDNCEHLLDVCAQVADFLLRSCPNLKILATSREALSVAGESSFRVPSLSIPQHHDDDSVDRLTQYESISLFADRAILVEPSFNLTHENASTVASICRRLDGIPLAIELTAAYVDVLQLPEILARLIDSFSLTVNEGRALWPRHQTLRTCIEWSWNLLDEAERTLLRRLSVFIGGWTLEAAETVCVGSGIVADRILALTNRLVKKSLVVVEQEAGHATRYRLLEMINQLAHEKLVEADEKEYYRKQHFIYFLALAENGYVELRGPNDLLWVGCLEAEHDNFRGALSWALESSSADSQVGLQLSGALYEFWAIRGYFIEGHKWLTEALRRSSDEPSIYLCRALCGAGSLLGPGNQCYEYLEPAISMAREIDAQTLLAEGLFVYAAKSPFSRPVDSKNYSLESLDIALRTEDKFIMALALSFIAAFIEEDLYKKLRLAEKAYYVAKELGNTRALAYTLAGLGSAQRDCGYLIDARTSCEERLRVVRMLGDQYWIASTLESLAVHSEQQGDYASAQRMYEESLQIFRDLNIQVQAAGVLQSLGWNAHLMGHDDRAVSLLEESLTTLRKHSQWSIVGLVLCKLGCISSRQNNSQLAKERFDEALDVIASGDIFIWRYLIRILEGISEIPILTTDQVTRLLSAATVLREKKGPVALPLLRVVPDALIEKARTELGEEQFNMIWIEGRGMTVEEVIAYARDCLKE